MKIDELTNKYVKLFVSPNNKKQFVVDLKEALNEAENEAAKQAYDRGYDAGYSEGYETGWAEGSDF